MDNDFFLPPPTYPTCMPPAHTPPPPASPPPSHVMKAVLEERDEEEGIERSSRGRGKHSRNELNPADPAKDERAANAASRGKGRSRSRSVEPLLKWSDYWEVQEDIHPTENPNDSFRVYRSGSEGPICFFLHGGGHTALSWSLVAKALGPQVRCIAYDARGHGDTRCEEDTDFSAARLVSDGLAVVEFYCRQIYESIHKTKWAEAPAAEAGDSKACSPFIPVAPLPGLKRSADPCIIIVGHSMGGAIATRIAASGKLPALHGLVVVDVVEGTAMAALPHMASFIKRLPTVFTSPREAVCWAIRSGTLKNEESARVSLPSQLVQTRRRDVRDILKKEISPGHEDDVVWTWRTDLAKTQPFWEGWFDGMSSLFLQARCTKVLICAGNDRLDRELMIAHMQGKFQVQLVPYSGHVVEEDQPQEVANVLLNFISRYRLDQSSVQPWRVHHSAPKPAS
ncbi:chain a, pp2a-specific methylesterase apo form (pme), putative [Toxoplasma gondii ME49]|uniref:Protein phosphatase methylesterase 1 n=1 Tax=Toxoplasma gondii (strain ATCC 50611 / Me49) TaxID=508771 RepID=S8F1L7_TOXGM|nr:chain a, pp2a-specific methylesterase apo form (pme), putative [Toxoplasma gondii ME49]EPT29626.1 chain a, pp2a-specific methylesterase apo form (pme), putative [Toxoplasma gondii ME49]|eukprot:XP_002365336.1 chain a, pp2a-specific methylesterase apo form (pme), putative [Toxoplasma gondii ME49]